jgi:hypothetical protein
MTTFMSREKSVSFINQDMRLRADSYRKYPTAAGGQPPRS